MNSEQSNQTQNESVIYINPKTDFGFKRLFMEGVRAKIRLLDLLKTFFPKPLRHVNRIVFDPSELLGDTEQEKRIVLDILATIDDKTEALVEMQRAVMEHFAERSIFYACRLVSKSLNRGDEYDLPNVLALFITEKPLPVFEGFDGFFHTVQLRSLDGKIFSEKIMLGYLDLSKFAALNPGQLKDMQFADRQEKWGYILANIGRMELQDLSQEDDVFRSVFEDSMHQKLTKMEKEEYKKSVLEYEDVQKAVRYAEKLGREEGLKEGFEQGREQGIEQGREQGREEEKRQLVRNMLAKGLTPDLVADIAGLTEEEVRAMSAEG